VIKAAFCQSREISRRAINTMIDKAREINKGRKTTWYSTSVMLFANNARGGNIENKKG